MNINFRDTRKKKKSYLKSTSLLVKLVIIVGTILLNGISAKQCKGFDVGLLKFDTPMDFSGSWKGTCLTTKGLLQVDPDFECVPQPDELSINLVEVTQEDPLGENVVVISPDESKGTFIMKYEGTFINHRTHFLETACGSEIPNFCPEGVNVFTQFGSFCQFNREDWSQTFDLAFSVGWHVEEDGKWRLFDPTGQSINPPITGVVREGEIPCGALFGKDMSGFIFSDPSDNWNLPVTDISNDFGVLAQLSGSSGETDTECGKTISDSFGGCVLPRTEGS